MSGIFSLVKTPQQLSSSNLGASSMRYEEVSATRDVSESNFPRGTQHYIPSAIEYGHAAPGQSGGAKTVPAKPFIRPAVDVKEDQSLRTTVNEVKRGIDSVWGK